MIVYEGSSRLDGAPILGIVTGVDRPSANPKTGPMAQLWILRADLSPLDALYTGADSSICGSCPLRGELGKQRACYVAIKNAPLQVYRAWQRGNYAPITPRALSTVLRARSIGIRLGAYGDPAALPIGVLKGLTAGVRHTGYTHQWRTATAYRSLLMASVDSAAELAQAQAKGWRTFRVRTSAEPVLASEVVCPASDEAGHRTTCAQCNLCKGAANGVKSVVIMSHGVGANNFVQLRRSAS